LRQLPESAKGEVDNPKAMRLGLQEGPESLYAEAFGLKDAPFRLTPDPDYLYLSDSHLSTYEKLIYGIRAGAGFILVTGEVGSGKTTVCRYLLREIEGGTDVAYVINPGLSFPELMGTILDDLGISYADHVSKKELLGVFSRYLLEKTENKRTVVLIDDAQVLPIETLEDLRLLSNLETDKEKLVQIVLVGQPELLETLALPGLRQLRQRIAIWCELIPLKQEELSEYIYLRLQRAGNQGQVRFSPSAVKEVAKIAGGLPRLTNLVCDAALLAAYVDGSRIVKVAHVRRAREEARLDRSGIGSLFRARPWVMVGVGLTIVLLIGWVYFVPF